jgi:hypothetical protein
MTFTVEMDEVRISCSSPRCIQRLLRYGWTLTDPSLSDDLVAQLAAAEAAGASEPERLHPSEPNPERVGDGFRPWRIGASPRRVEPMQLLSAGKLSGG